MAFFLSIFVFTFGEINKSLKMKAYIPILFAITLFLSCKKKSEDSVKPGNTCACSPYEPAYKCVDCKTSSSAKPAYDNSNLGVYKGVLIGSSGTFTITMQENDTTASLSFDGKNLVLTKTKFESTGGNLEATFKSDSVVLSISVSSNGSVASVSTTIPGHTNIITSVLKEKSGALVKAFEGSFTGNKGSSGVFNMVTVDSTVYVIWKNTDGNSGTVNGTVNTNKLTGTGAGALNVNGTFTDSDNANGTWSQPAESGTWAGKRTL